MTRTFPDCVPIEVERIARVLPDSFALAGNGKGRCIEAARILTAALSPLGVPARPMACSLVCANRQAAAYLDALGPGEVIDYPPDCFTIGSAIDKGPVPTVVSTEPYRLAGFHGHVIVTSPLGPAGWFVDLTIEQFHRPERGVVIEGAIAGPLEADAGGVVLDRADGDSSSIRWYFEPRVAAFRNTPAWRQDIPADLLDKLVAVGRGET